MVTHRGDYAAEAVEAARSVLVEIIQLLGAPRARARRAGRACEDSAKFRAPEDAGPRWVADFLGETDLEARAILQRRVYEEITAWLDPLGVEPWQASG